MESNNPATQLNPYLTFNGNCEEAINTYHKILGGEIKMKSTFGEGPMETPEALKDKIMHIHFEFDGQTILASDFGGQGSFTPGTNVHLSLYISEPDRADRVFAQLSEGGQVTMPFNEVFWGGKFGSLLDAFGIQWMVSCP